jgi:pyruvate dehydrogenase E1 component alpha subunit
VIVNNGWAISLPAKEQTAAETYAQKGLGNGVPGIQVDGNDVLGVRKVMQDALARARAGDGPTIVEAVTYRLSDHTTADDGSRYRSAAEVDAAWKVEPLLRTRRFLETRGLWNEARESGLRAECTAAIEAAVRGYQGRSAAGTDSMFDHLFANPPAALAEQMQIARRYGAGPAH